MPARLLRSKAQQETVNTTKQPGPSRTKPKEKKNRVDQQPSHDQEPLRLGDVVTSGEGQVAIKEVDAAAIRLVFFFLKSIRLVLAGAGAGIIVTHVQEARSNQIRRIETIPGPRRAEGTAGAAPAEAALLASR